MILYRYPGGIWIFNIYKYSNFPLGYLAGSLSSRRKNLRDPPFRIKHRSNQRDRCKDFTCLSFPEHELESVVPRLEVRSWVISGLDQESLKDERSCLELKMGWKRQQGNEEGEGKKEGNKDDYSGNALEFDIQHLVVNSPSDLVSMEYSCDDTASCFFQYLFNPFADNRNCISGFMDSELKKQ